MLIHSGEKPYSCSQCSLFCTTAGNPNILPYLFSQTFPQTNPLTSNLTSYSLLHNMFQPSGPGPVLSTTLQLVIRITSHIRTHSGQTTFHRDQCNYTSTQATHLKQHKLKHTGEKLFSCSQCRFSCSKIIISRIKSGSTQEKSRSNAINAMQPFKHKSFSSERIQAHSHWSRGVL